MGLKERMEKSFPVDSESEGHLPSKGNTSTTSHVIRVTSRLQSIHNITSLSSRMLCPDPPVRDHFLIVIRETEHHR